MKFGRPELIWSIINFVVFAVVMTRLLYHPVLSLLDDRAKSVSRQRELAERDRVEIERQRREVETGLAEADQRAHALMVTTAKRVKEAEEQAVTSARAAAAKVMANARRQVERERELALADLRRDAGNLVVTAAERALARSLDDRTQRELIDEAIAAIGAGE